MSPRRKMILGVLALGVLTPGVVAQDDATPPPPGAAMRDLLALVAPLDDPIYEVREQAEDRLIDVGTPTLGQLHALLRSGRLSPEQHARVRQVALARFASTPRAGMGVQFDPGAPGGARIQKLVDGFPAAGIIEPGDQIVEAAGVPVNNSAHLGALILSHDAGDIMSLRVIRDEQTIDLEIPLGAFSDLGQAANPRTLEAAYRVRADRDGAPERALSGALGVGLTLEDWTRAELGADPPESLPTGAADQRGGGIERASIVGGVAHAKAPDARVALAARATGSASAWLIRRGELSRRRALLEREVERARAEGDPGASELGKRLEKYDAMLAELNRRLGLADDVITP
ncbi:MAG: PDZ domain-containing protein [Phycisphaerales bacterium]